ncbi:hypothetical protein [Empedobacter sp. UBA7620]|uniref:hypothetical protein n=1 Tax=Empedobacter sp. UBA7620 TaxID=1946452 RepID=UPI0025C6B8FE|nr:hypothetical protein [Empedobacter sp. UBA7620]
MKDYLNEYSIFDYGGVNHVSDDVAIFPSGEGSEIALISLANYPYDTDFIEIETIGVIISFLSMKNNKRKIKEPWKSRDYHLSFYVDDLIELYELEFIEGIKPITEFKYELNSFNCMVSQGYPLNVDGNIDVYFLNDSGERIDHIIEMPKIEKYVENYLGEEWNEDDREELIKMYEDQNTPFIEYTSSLKLTEKGYRKYLDLTQDFFIPKQIDTIIKPLIKIGYYDSAVREIAVLFEHMIKDFHKSDLIGSQLIEMHIRECIKANKGNNNAGIKVYRQELKAANSYIRNEFMHNVMNVEKANYNAILFRQCRLFGFINQAKEKIKTQNYC